MSTPEEIDLQLLHKDGEVEEQKPLEQPKAVKVTTSRVKKILLCVLTLLSYLCVYAAMSSVTAFYAIVVSACMLAIGEVLWYDYCASPPRRVYA